MLKTNQVTILFEITGISLQEEETTNDGRNVFLHHLETLPRVTAFFETLSRYENLALMVGEPDILHPHLHQTKLCQSSQQPVAYPLVFQPDNQRTEESSRNERHFLTIQELFNLKCKIRQDLRDSSKADPVVDIFRHCSEVRAATT